MATEEQVAVCAPSEMSHSQCSYQSKNQIPKSVLCHYHRVSLSSDRNQFPGCLLVLPAHTAGSTHRTHAGGTNSPDDIHFTILHSLSHSFSSGIPHWHPLLERGLFRKSIPTQSTLPSLSDMDDIRFIFPSTIASLRRTPRDPEIHLRVPSTWHHLPRRIHGLRDRCTRFLTTFPRDHQHSSHSGL